MIRGKFDSSYYHNPKIIQAGRDARDLHFGAIQYAVRCETDGFVPDSVIHSLDPMMGPRTARGALRKLLVTGLLTEAPGGYEINDFLDFQATRDEAEKSRIATRTRVQRHRANRRNANGNALQPPLQDEGVTPGVTVQAGTGTSTNSSSRDQREPHPAAAAAPQDDPDHLLHELAAIGWNHAQLEHARANPDLAAAWLEAARTEARTNAGGYAWAGYQTGQPPSRQAPHQTPPPPADPHTIATTWLNNVGTLIESENEIRDELQRLNITNPEPLIDHWRQLHDPEPATTQ